MTDINGKLSAALRAQASGAGTGAPAEPPTPLQRGSAQAERRMPGWAILVLAVLLGATAGGLAGVISTW